MKNLKTGIIVSLALFLFSCGSPDRGLVTSESASSAPTQENQTQGEIDSTVEPSELFTESQCDSVSYSSFGIVSHSDCWTEFVYLNNDNENVAIHFFPASGSGQLKTLIEYEDRRLRLFSEIDIEAFTDEAYGLLNETLTVEEKDYLRRTQQEGKLRRSKLTIESNKLCLDHRGEPPLYGVISICQNDEPIVAYYVRERN